MPIELEIRLIKYGSAEYDDEVRLREEALIKPIGLSLYNEDLSSEINDTHIGAYINNKLIGVLILTKHDDDVVQMRQVGVYETLRGKDIGKRIVLYSEEYARNKGYKMMILHARETVIGFYKKLGYQITGNRFTEVNIPHFKMFRIL
jgi:predicted GNAT family N-acyltransferase